MIAPQLTPTDSSTTLCLPDNHADRVAERDAWRVYIEQTSDIEGHNFIMRLAERIGYACDGREKEPLYRVQICEMQGWPATARNLARVSRLLNTFARMGIISKRLDRSECPRDKQGNYLSFQGCFNWVRVARAPGPFEREPEPPEKPAKPVKHTAVQDVQCPVCGGIRASPVRALVR